MSELSGGSFFREENFHELKDALRSISSGRVIITEIVLWQSFGWLVFVVSILGLEMVKLIASYVVKFLDFTTIPKKDALNALK